MWKMPLRALSEVGDRYEANVLVGNDCFRCSFSRSLGYGLGSYGCFWNYGCGRGYYRALSPRGFDALLTTAAALCVAIPIVFVYNGLLGMTRGR